MPLLLNELLYNLLVQIMQHDDGSSANPPYTFRRDTSEALDTLIMSGRGPPAHPNGLSRSLFRPSDDAVTLPYNVPGKHNNNIYYERNM